MKFAEVHALIHAGNSERVTLIESHNGNPSSSSANASTCRCARGQGRGWGGLGWQARVRGASA